MHKLSAFSFGTLFAVLGVVTAAPAEAARLQFNFTTEQGGVGSFILDTETEAVPESELPDFFTIREGNQAYLNAVSNFSFSSPYLNFENLDADYGVFPTVDFGPLLGVPDTPGVYTAVYAPAGCLFEPLEFCPTEFPIAYTGDVSELPNLADDPSTFAEGFDIASVDPLTGVISSDPLTSFSVEAVPEPASVVGVLLLGGVSFCGSLRKRLSRHAATQRGPAAQQP